ncbi:MAG TPA: class I SAM-dependent DNA methyltransferase [Thermoplasmatales archaeon]|nr:class I SAM-dependent DNA methyltransferase [Thermoplasmatales archaeon]
MVSKKILLEEIDADEIAKKIKQKAQKAANEEELRIGFAIVLDPLLESWEISPAYERHASGMRCIVSGIRKDALYGTVILEFKAPGKLDSQKEFEKAKEQVKKYIKNEAVDKKYYGRYFGVLTDGYHISFIRFRKETWEETELLEINSHTILRLLEAIRGLRRKPIDAALLLEDFGPKSEVSRKSILIFYNNLEKTKSSRTKMLFNDWRRVFSQVCSYSTEKLKGLIKYYGIEKEKIVDVEKLMFAIHTYYTILMKLLTSEIVTLFADSLIGSYLKKIEEAYLKDNKEMMEELKELEEGGIFRELGIKNFLEADYFAWYLDEWSSEIATAIYEISKKLLDYEPATVELTPERIKDLFKRLYQNLVPRDVRHKLGEYFTPDWLAELLLEEVGYDGNPDKSVLDPACGSGTFLVLTIKKMREYAQEHFIDERTLLSKIVNDVKGIDLNPLAVLASKANYLIALADLLRYRPKEGIEIPIYLADSIAVGRRAKLSGEWEMYIKTVEGELWIPHEVIDKGKLSIILYDIEFCIHNKYSPEQFENYLKRTYELKEESVESLKRLYIKLLSLESRGKNRIWTRILRNSFSPLLMKKFDYVIGNPPWINWEHLPQFYREQTRGLWEWYGLTKRTKGMGLGKVKRDMAMLFVARCLDRYTKDGGKFAFLIPFTVYKTQAGAGFRSFLAKGKNENVKVPCKILKIHDLVTLYPFEGAVNRTSLLILKKEERTEFPIPCIMWHNPRSKGIDQEAELEEVRGTTKQFELVFLPIEKGKAESPWMEITEKAYEGVKKILKKQVKVYKAHKGVDTSYNSIYWLKVLNKVPSGLQVKNLNDIGKKKVILVTSVIESELVYPLVRGRDQKKWYVSPSSYIIVPHNPNGKCIDETSMKMSFPKTYGYLMKFEKELKQRAYVSLTKKGEPFYTLQNISWYTFTNYKVVWKHISGKISGKAKMSAALLRPIQDKYIGKKIIIPDHSLVFISTEKLEEGYYLAAVLNSIISSFLVRRDHPIIQV